MSVETEQALADWENEERDVSDDLHWHFKDFGRWDWCEISNEACRVNNLMFAEEVEMFSARYGIWSAAAAQAAHGAFSAVAAALGVDREALEWAIEDWYHHQDSLPAAVGFAGFFEKIEESKRERQELEQELQTRGNEDSDAGASNAV